jgi:Mg2+ and Co2+ transporter CorA
MKRQSRRATVLTLLAAFYLPLSLVTGIFGMNIKEFDDVKPSFVRLQLP